MNIQKILNIVTIALFAITVVILCMFVFGGDVPNQQYPTPVYTAALINWAYILFGIAILSAFIFPIARLATRPKQAMKSFIGLAVIGLLVLIAYALADGTPFELKGYQVEDNIPSMLILADTILFTMYFLFGGAILAVAGTEIYNKIK